MTSDIPNCSQGAIFQALQRGLLVKARVLERNILWNDHRGTTDCFVIIFKVCKQIGERIHTWNLP